MSKTEKYGYSRTEPADTLLEWILNNNIQEIQLCRNDLSLVIPVLGKGIGGNPTIGVAGRTKSNSRKYVCPECGMIVRATREVNVLCGDCMCGMKEG